MLPTKTSLAVHRGRCHLSCNVNIKKESDIVTDSDIISECRDSSI